MLDLDVAALLRSRVVGAKKRTLLAVSALVLLWLVGNSLLGGGSSEPPASKTDGAGSRAAAQPPRVPEGWETLDATPGFDRWAQKCQDPRTGVAFILVEPGRFMMGSPDGEGEDDEQLRARVSRNAMIGVARVEE